ncbi:hypothetical protein AKJ36_00055 [candidate division MSBL1 archaeon SCGC-AAA259I07]|uniref:Uncharacterized protein n=1 Tax=candidate division MSBL1 archaeon SCGC-AAA259I07 TaxID=1698266 RepID=A0A133UN42_9EURY|nr:hypothetical protein AKJ36_00055 [candidate division MSBL1 archaeon SCGC-AAA259I07]
MSTSDSSTRESGTRERSGGTKLFRSRRLTRSELWRRTRPSTGLYGGTRRRTTRGTRRRERL